jgi:hypothetical protein
MAVGPRSGRWTTAVGVGLGLLLATLLAALAAGSAWAGPVSAAPTPTTATVSVSVSDGVSSAKPGSQHTYQVVVTNGSDVDEHLLLEITPPAAAIIDDAGGGTMNDAFIDYGVSVAAHGQVSERFQLTLGPARVGQTQAETLASAFLLGPPASDGSTNSADGGAAAARAADSDAIDGVGAASAARAAAARPAASVGASGHHTGLWIAALAIGALLIIVGVAVIFWPAPPPGRRRASSGRAARRAAPARAVPTGAGVSSHNGAHQAPRAHAGQRTRRTRRTQHSAP